MSGVGRNSPCPCGSEKKYKKCCLNKTPPAVGAYTSDERERGFAAVETWLRADGSWWELVAQRFAKLLKGRGEALERAEVDPYTYAAFSHAAMDWIAFDVRNDDRYTIVEDMVDRKPRLPAGVRSFLQDLVWTSIRPFEILETVPGDSITVCDMAEEMITTVHERSASKTLKPGALLIGRIAPGVTERPEFERGLLVIPWVARQQLDEAVKGWEHAMSCGSDAADEDLGLALLDLWIAGTVEGWGPRSIGFRGEPYVLATARFGILNEALLRQRIEHLEALEPTGVEHEWVLRGADGELAGTMQIDGDQLVFEAPTERLGNEGRRTLEDILSDSIVYESITYQEPLLAAGEAGPFGASSIDGAPPKVEQAIIDQFLTERYTLWLDESIPALGGATPREAAADPKLLPKLKRLLRDLDRQHPLSEDTPGVFDPSFLWEELGLQR